MTFSILFYFGIVIKNRIVGFKVNLKKEESIINNYIKAFVFFMVQQLNPKILTWIKQRINSVFQKSWNRREGKMAWRCSCDNIFQFVLLCHLSVFREWNLTSSRYIKPSFGSLISIELRLKFFRVITTQSYSLPSYISEKSSELFVTFLKSEFL